MSKSRSPAKEEQSPSVSSTGSAGVEADRTGKEIADALDRLGALVGDNHSDRQLVRTTFLELLGNARHASKILNTIDQSLREQVKAENEDREKQTDAKIRDQDERRAAELDDARNRRIGKEKREDRSQTRKDERHAQSIKERETNREDGSRERNLFMWLTAISVVAAVAFGACTLVFLFLTAKYAEPWGYFGAGVGLALTGITSFAGSPRRLRWLISLVRSEGSEQRKQEQDENQGA